MFNSIGKTDDSGVWVMNSEEPLISVIIVTCDRPQVLRRCLEHVLAQEYPRFEVIVVDNSSLQAETCAVVQDFPLVHYIRSDTRRANPAYMRNQGIDQSRGEILAFIDDDSLVTPGWMNALVEGLSDPAVGGVTGRVIEKSAPVVDTTDIGRLLPDGTLVMNFNNVTGENTPVDFIYGCNQAIKKSALAEHGLFDPWFAMAYEDTEIGLRLRRSGYQLLFVPNMKVEHLQSPRPPQVVQRSGHFDSRALMMSCRSLVYLCVSHFGIRMAFLRTAFFKLPKSWMKNFLREPSVRNFLNILYGLVGISFGFQMAILRWVRLYRPPILKSNSSVRGLSL